MRISPCRTPGSGDAAGRGAAKTGSSPERPRPDSSRAMIRIEAPEADTTSALLRRAKQASRPASSRSSPWTTNGSSAGRRPLATASSAMASVSTTPHAPSQPPRQGPEIRQRQQCRVRVRAGPLRRAGVRPRRCHAGGQAVQDQEAVAAPQADSQSLNTTSAEGRTVQGRTPDLAITLSRASRHARPRTSSSGPGWRAAGSGLASEKRA